MSNNSNFCLSPLNCTSHRARQFSRVLARFFDAQISKAGLKTSQFSLLTTIANRGPIASGALAQHLAMSASTVTRNLKPLMANGWVEQHRCEDARTRMIAATEAGRVKQADAFAYWTTAQTQFNEAVGTDRVEALQSLMDQCSASLRLAADGKFCP